MKEAVKILIADDDQAVVLTLEKLIKKSFPDLNIIKAYDGLEAWNEIKLSYPEIVISDISMPKMDGIHLCNRIRSGDDTSQIYVIMITGDFSSERKIQVISQGADDFLIKPIPEAELVARIKSGLRIVSLNKQIKSENNLLNELAEELEHDIEDMTRLALKFLQARIPASFDMMKRVSNAVTWIAEQLGDFTDDQIKDLEIAAFFAESGRIILPDDLIEMPVQKDGMATHKLMYQVPVASKDIALSVRRFKDCGHILYHIYENYDGSGFPEKLQSWQIPIESRIIRAVLDYESTKSHSKQSPREVMALIKSESKRLYDYRVVVLLDQYVKSVIKEDYDPNEYAVRLYELKPNMILTQDIMTSNGLKLLTAGAVLKLDTIDKILSHNTSDPILGSIYVKK
jgi:putative two-component system response regulator